VSLAQGFRAQGYHCQRSMVATAMPQGGLLCAFLCSSSPRRSPMNDSKKGLKGHARTGVPVPNVQNRSPVLPAQQQVSAGLGFRTLNPKGTPRSSGSARGAVHASQSCHGLRRAGALCIERWRQRWLNPKHQQRQCLYRKWGGPSPAGQAVLHMRDRPVLHMRDRPVLRLRLCHCCFTFHSVQHVLARPYTCRLQGHAF
jgi:hypothetical protein